MRYPCLKIMSVFHITLMKLDIFDSRWIVTFENVIFIIYNFEILHNLKYFLSKPRTSIVDFNFQLSHRNFETPPPPRRDANADCSWCWNSKLRKSYFRYKCEKVISSSWGHLRPSEVMVKRPHEDKITLSLVYRTQSFYTTCTKRDLAYAFLFELARSGHFAHGVWKIIFSNAKILLRLKYRISLLDF